MPTLIRWTAASAPTRPRTPSPPSADDEPIPPRRRDRLAARASSPRATRLLAEGRKVGVRIEAERGGRGPGLRPAAASPWSRWRSPSSATAAPIRSARLLRERYGFTGEVRAVGDVLREQARFMVRCGFDAFEPADGSTPEALEPRRAPFPPRLSARRRRPRPGFRGASGMSDHLGGPPSHAALRRGPLPRPLGEAFSAHFLTTPGGRGRGPSPSDGTVRGYAVGDLP